MRCFLWVVPMLALLGSCDHKEGPTIPKEPIIGNWVLHLNSEGTLVEQEDFEIWTLEEDGTFIRHETKGDICTGKKGVWELGGNDRLWITLFPNTGLDSTWTLSYRLDGDELYMVDLGTNVQTHWKRTQDDPLIVFDEKGYCQGE